ncbi:MAG: DoxX family membrane protein [Bacteroidia bacterium]|nr:DoxX family membrane protein [Bacteroidia bacterium]
MEIKIIKIFLRLSLSASFLYASIDRFNDILGILNPNTVFWGNWSNFMAYSAKLMPWFPYWIVLTLAIIATIGEIVFGICLLIGWKTSQVARLSGLLLLLFAIFMSLTVGIPTVLSYSVYSASAAAFALSTFKVKFLEFK